MILQIHISIWNSQNISLKKRNKNHTLFEQKRRRIFPMIKTMLKLLFKLTANFLIRCLVKKYMSRIVWPHMNILLTYQNKHVHIIIYIFHSTRLRYWKTVMQLLAALSNKACLFPFNFYFSLMGLVRVSDGYTITCII